MKATIIQTLADFDSGRLRFADGERTVDDPDNRQLLEPVRAISEFELQYGTSYREDDQIWLFRNRVVRVDDHITASPAEVALAVKHVVLRCEQDFADMQSDTERLQRFEQAVIAQRDPIPRAVQMFVWRRDQGRCVRCGSNQNLEFDHIIPVALGGGNTERNVQLLCEDCNRAKGTTIG